MRDALIEVYKEYVSLLETELQALIGFAWTHGYRSMDATIERGDTLRAEIRRLSNNR